MLKSIEEWIRNNPKDLKVILPKLYDFYKKHIWGSSDFDIFYYKQSMVRIYDTKENRPIYDLVIEGNKVFIRHRSRYGGCELIPVEDFCESVNELIIEWPGSDMHELGVLRIFGENILRLTKHAKQRVILINGVRHSPVMYRKSINEVYRVGVLDYSDSVFLKSGTNTLLNPYGLDTSKYENEPRILWDQFNSAKVNYEIIKFIKDADSFCNDYIPYKGDGNYEGKFVQLR